MSLHITPKATKKKLQFRLSYDDRVPEFVHGDRLRLFQVLCNLLDNALKFTEEGHITLQVMLNQKRANKANMRFEVSDTGIGIADSQQKSIFESFVQLDEKNNGQGAGLGLPIAKGLLELMGSSLQLTSVVGSGSTFFFDISMGFQLKLSSENLMDPSTNKRSIKKRNRARKYKLLMVEDDERIQAVLFKALLDTNIFYIDLVNDGALVLETVMNGQYDIILMDVDLPNVSGDQNTRLIREFPFNNIKNIPIVGITANAFEEDVAAYLKTGMNAVIPKPFEFLELIDTLLKLLEP